MLSSCLRPSYVTLPQIYEFSVEVAGLNGENMTQTNSSKVNWVIRLLGAAAFTGAVSTITLVAALASSNANDKAVRTQQAYQATQLSQQQTQIYLANAQNQLLSLQLTLAVEQSHIEAQLLTQFPAGNAGPSSTAIAAIVQATQIEATRQAVVAQQQSIAATQTAFALELTPANPTAKLLRTQLFDSCHSAAWIELSGFSPNSAITVKSDAYDINCDTGIWRTSTWTQAFGQPTSPYGQLIIAYDLGRGDYRYTFTDQVGHTANLSFSIRP